MAVDAATFDRAFSEFQEFGPRRSIPIEERWAEMFPEIPATEHEPLKSHCTAIEAFALAQAEQFRDDRVAISEAYQRISARFPELTSERLNRVWNQAVYFSLRS